MTAPYRLAPLHPVGETMEARLRRLAPREIALLLTIGYIEERIAERRALGLRTLCEEAALYIATGSLERVRRWMAEAREAIDRELGLDHETVARQLSVLPESWRRVIPRDAGPAEVTSE